MEDIRKKLSVSEPTLLPLQNDSVFTGQRLSVFDSVTGTELDRLIAKAPCKTCALDPLPTTLTKACQASHADPNLALLNSSLEGAVVPTNFKMALVTPLLKKASLDECSKEL